MSAHENVIRRFYEAFGRRDHETMASCYHPEVRFSDPVFTDLRGDRVAAMWRMLCERGTDLRIELVEAGAEGDRGRARWDAWYTFSATGRPVHNQIAAELAFADGLIIRHTDTFDFHRWSRQALGLPGLLLGWSGFLRRKVQTQAGGQLERFAAKR